MIPLYTVNDESKRITISDSIRAQDGSPIVNALVRLFRNGVPVSKTVKTDAEGKFSLDSLPYGDYHVEVLANNILAPVSKTYILDSATLTGTPLEGVPTWDSCEGLGLGLGYSEDLWHAPQFEFGVGAIWHTNGVISNDYYENKTFVCNTGTDFSDVLAQRANGGGALAMPHTPIGGEAFPVTPIPGSSMDDFTIVNPFDYYLDTDGHWYHYRYGNRIPEYCYMGDYASPHAGIKVPEGFHFDSAVGPFGTWFISDVNNLTYYSDWNITDPGAYNAIPLYLYLLYHIDSMDPTPLFSFVYGNLSNIKDDVGSACIPLEFLLGSEHSISSLELSSGEGLPSWMYTGGTSEGIPPLAYTEEIEENIYKYKAVSQDSTIPKSKKKYILNELVIKPRVTQLQTFLGITETQAKAAVIRESNLGTLTSTYDTPTGADVWNISDDISNYALTGMDTIPVVPDTYFSSGEFNFIINNNNLAVVGAHKAAPEVKEAISTFGTSEWDTAGKTYLQNLMRFSKVPRQVERTSYTLPELDNILDDISQTLNPTQEFSPETLAFVNNVDSKTADYLGADTVGGRYIALAASGAGAYSDSGNKYESNPYYGFAKGALMAQLPGLGEDSRNLVMDTSPDITHYQPSSYSIKETLVIGALGVYQFVTEGVGELVDAISHSVGLPGLNTLFSTTLAPRGLNNTPGLSTSKPVKEREWYEKAYDDWEEESLGYMWAVSTGWKAENTDQFFQSGVLAAQWANKLDPSYTLPTTAMNPPTPSVGDKVLPAMLYNKAFTNYKEYEGAELSTTWNVDKDSWDTEVSFIDENGVAQSHSEAGVYGAPLALNAGNTELVANLERLGFERTSYEVDPADVTKMIATFAKRADVYGAREDLKIFQVSGGLADFDAFYNSNLTAEEYTDAQHDNLLARARDLESARELWLTAEEINLRTEEADSVIHLQTLYHEYSDAHKVAKECREAAMEQWSRESRTEEALHTAKVKSIKAAYNRDHPSWSIPCSGNHYVDGYGCPEELSRHQASAELSWETYKASRDLCEDTFNIKKLALEGLIVAEISRVDLLRQESWDTSMDKKDEVNGAWELFQDWKDAAGAHGRTWGTNPDGSKGTRKTFFF